MCVIVILKCVLKVLVQNKLFFSSFIKWDFEETKTQWIPVEEAPEDLQKAEAFPLQEGPVNSITESTGRPGSHVCSCNRTQLAKKLAST